MIKPTEGEWRVEYDGDFGYEVFKDTEFIFRTNSEKDANHIRDTMNLMAEVREFFISHTGDSFFWRHREDRYQCQVCGAMGDSMKSIKHGDGCLTGQSQAMLEKLEASDG